MPLYPDPRDFTTCPECDADNPYGGDYDHAYYGAEVDPPEWAPAGASALRIECQECGHAEVVVTCAVVPA